MDENQEQLEQAGWRVMLEGVQEHWLGSFLLNLIGYGLIILPAALLIRRWKRSQLVQKGMLFFFFFLSVANYLWLVGWCNASVVLY